MSVNVFEPKSQFKAQSKEIIKAIKKVLNSGNYILGKEVLKLEKNFSSIHNLNYGVAVKNGTIQSLGPPASWVTILFSRSIFLFISFIIL